MALADLESALTAFQTAANAVDTDNTSKTKTATALAAAKAADDAAAAQVATDTSTMQTAFDKVVSEAVGLGLKVNTPAA